MKKTSLLLPIGCQHSVIAKGLFNYSWYQKVKGLWETLPSHRLGERSPTTQLPLAEAIQDEDSILTSKHFWSPLWQQVFCLAMCSACLQPLTEVRGALDSDLFPQEGDQPFQFMWDWRSSQGVGLSEQKPEKSRANQDKLLNQVPCHRPIIAAFSSLIHKKGEGQCGPGKNKSAPNNSSHMVVHLRQTLC